MYRKKLSVIGLMYSHDKQSKDYFNEMKSLRNKLNPKAL